MGGDQCQSCLVPSSLGRFPQIEVYGGWNNPMSYDGTENYDTRPHNYTDVNTMQHDKNYDAMGGKGPSSVFFNTNVIPADLELINDSFDIALTPDSHVSLTDKFESLVIGTIFLIITAPKIAISMNLH